MGKVAFVGSTFVVGVSLDALTVVNCVSSTSVVEGVCVVERGLLVGVAKLTVVGSIFVVGVSLEAPTVVNCVSSTSVVEGFCVVERGSLVGVAKLTVVGLNVATGAPVAEGASVVCVVKSVVKRVVLVVIGAFVVCFPVGNFVDSGGVVASEFVLGMSGRF